MDPKLRNTLKWITQIQLLVLLFGILIKITDRYLLNSICFWVLRYPDTSGNNILWWQRFSTTERLGWRFIDYVESK
ncbi:uncharacterized protein KNAG_0G01360 [Huiozyma naganishii CBS 8797]|uniref:Uncharacterized protein n=1 Tax=Huiozyma naganishii (strain ATCC MYA-139 / BCRC 22969 / CBS 8797 / KCTC 17520 / NBRC 10181 / NCYC 3082 / Yp74L-3) TaxID=1071383 RepID=J7S7V1_HUIN7|nr:hypothetical protein KNAG_0G01360 [Kazachstania naganishii CBS 8797]CCK71194.1 hypothetical protein KNAG_0G01360 [Kazachstania naganishii CBS 8797]